MKPIAFVVFAGFAGVRSSFTIERVRGHYEFSRRENGDRVSLATFTTEIELRALLDELPPELLYDPATAACEDFSARSLLLAQFLEATPGTSDEFSVRRRRKEIARLRVDGTDISQEYATPSSHPRVGHDDYPGIGIFAQEG